MNYRKSAVIPFKACYPSAAEIEEIERRNVLNILEEESDEETFLGFPEPESSLPKTVCPSAVDGTTDEEDGEEESMQEAKVPTHTYPLRRRSPKHYGK